MRKIFSEEKLWVSARTILDVLCVKTNCFGPDNKVIRAKFLVAIDDDVTSAKYAAEMYHLIFKEYGYHPIVICVGGLGLLSKPMNGKGVTEGLKQSHVCHSFGVEVSDIVVLDKGSNTGLNARDIALFQLEYFKKQIFDNTKGSNISSKELQLRLGKISKATIFCVTERLSWRLERTVKFLSRQYEDDFSVGGDCFEIDDFYYVPKQNWDDMKTYFNGKAFANGIMLLAEIASIWDRYLKTKGRFMLSLDSEIEKEFENKIGAIAKELAKEMPLKVPGFNIRKLWQYPFAYIDVVSHKELAKVDLQRWMEKQKYYRDTQIKYCPYGY